MAEHREYTITFDTDDYVCRNGDDLQVDDLIREIERVCREHPKSVIPDMVIWEHDRVCAIIHHTGQTTNPLTVMRFDQPSSCSA